MITQRMLQAENLLDSLPAKGIILATTTEAFSLHAAHSGPADKDARGNCGLLVKCSIS